MKDGFVKVAAATPNVKVADPVFNSEEIYKNICLAYENQAKVLVLPELALTGYSCSDLFGQDIMIRKTKDELIKLIHKTKDMDMIYVLGLPYKVDYKLYNVAAFIYKGHLLGMVPKTFLPNYGEFYEARHFAKGKKEVQNIDFDGYKVPFGTNILFQCTHIPELVLAGEVCEDVWVPNPPSISHTLAGATVICNTSASDEITTKESYRKNLISIHSARLICGYIYANAGDGESTTDVCYSGHNIICENGSLLCESKRFDNEIIYSEIDVFKLVADRSKMTTYVDDNHEVYTKVAVDLQVQDTKITRHIDRYPFVPANEIERNKRCEEILTIQAAGLKKRIEHTYCKRAVIGLSGGLDSTLALLVTVKAFDMLGLEHSGIMCVTMPGFGTTDRTYNNALSLAQSLGATLKEISIVPAVIQHFKDIEHDANVHDVTYENSQARERTMLLMDLANKTNGMVIGTGDMSELALGWATYNGDHMSMYAVNCSVPKTLVRYLVRFYADNTDKKTKEVLLDVLDTPVSPELLPPSADGTISQKTEDIVGPYELHDFYLYYLLRFGFAPSKIYRLATIAFDGEYDLETIKKWLHTFYRRFFMQQFKRSCIPDGPKVGTVALSPRGDLRMPSDAVARIWLEEVDSL